MTASAHATTDIVETARRIADQKLFPAATDVDALTDVPRDRLDALAAAGLYGLLGPADAGGIGADVRTACRVVEEIASGCLSTAFVWLQHLGAPRAVAAAGEPVRSRWSARLCSGASRAGVAIAGVRPRARDPLRVRRARTGWILDGVAPWVTGWGRVDVIRTAALDGDDVVWLLVDAVPSATLTVERVDLAAVDASATVTARFAGHEVAADRFVAAVPYAGWQEADARGLRMNGSLALGVASRCARLLGDDALGAELVERRDALDAAHDAVSDGDASRLPPARAAASELALRAATRLVVVTGAGAVRRDADAQRLLREAMFLLVFGSRPSIKDELLRAIAG